ncbi:MAG: DUF1501 domain-containing protein [Caulobacteraceae bacterium]
MTAQPVLTRRSALGAGLAASFLGHGAFAASPDLARRKLVVIIARGAMDGLSATPPIGDPDYVRLRGEIAIPADAALKLDTTFALHPKLEHLHGLTKVGQARIAPAVAIPQRIRSHFEAQDLLESGGAQLYGVTTGWLNRTLTVATSQKALSVGAQTPLILRGPAQAQSWSPGGKAPGATDRIVAQLQDLYRNDPLLGPAFASGLETEAMASGLMGDGGTMGAAPAMGANPQGQGRQAQAVNAAAFAETAGKFLVQPGGPSIAVLSLDGFDTHARQGAVDGQLATRLRLMDQVIAGLQTGLGSAWKDTVIVVATEFGRTARINGTQGTDHGTASTLFLAGGSIKPGGIVGDWPTLQEAKLFENRDLAPTLDIRSVFKGVLADHLGVDGRALDTQVFPNSADAKPLRGLVA